MSMCSVISCVVGRVCLLWPVHSLGNSVSLCPASFCTPRPSLPITPGISWLPTFVFQFLWWKGLFFFQVLVLESLVCLHRITQLHLQQLWLGHRLGLLWYWFALEMNLDHSVVFDIAPKYCILDSFVDCEGYSISSKGFLPTVIDIMVIWIKFTHFHHCSSLIPKMLMFTLAISCLTTSNFPWFMDLTFQVLLQYCSLQHQTFTFTTRHIHNWVSLLLWPSPFIRSGAISLLFPRSIFDIYIKPVNPKGNQSWIFIGRTDTEAETPILWPPDEKSQLTGKDPNAGKDWRQEKGTTEDEMVGWHHWLNEPEVEQAPRVGDGQGSLVCCIPRGHKVLDTTVTELNWSGVLIFRCHIFFPLHTVLGFSRQAYWSSLPLPSPVTHILSELSTMTHLSWVALHGVAHSFIELLWSMLSFLWAFRSCGFHSGSCGIVVLASSVCPLMDEDKRLVQASWWEGLAVQKTGSCSTGRTMPSKSLIQSAADGLYSFPVSCLAWGDSVLESKGSMVGLMVTTKRTYANSHLLGI